MKIWKKYSRAISYTHRAAWSVALILLPRNSANGKGFSWFINVFSFRKQTTWLLFCSDINNKEDLPLNHQQQLAHLHTPGSHQSSQVNNITDGLTDWVTDNARQWSDLGPITMSRIIVFLTIYKCHFHCLRFSLFNFPPTIFWSL